MIPKARKFSILTLLALGTGLFALMSLNAGMYNLSLVDQKQFAIDDDAWIQRIVLFAAVILALIPMTRRGIAAAFAFLRRPSATVRRRTAWLIALLSGPLLYGLGAARRRLGLPIWHDENMYRMQTNFLAHGKFCLPGLPIQTPGSPQLDPATAHRLADFFDSPYIFVHDVYAPVYFPGTALLHVPAAWMHLPYWLTPMIIAAISLTVLYLIVTELIDGLAGLLAVLLMISLLTFRWLALVEMSHAAGMLWGLVALWAWLRWRREAGEMGRQGDKGTGGQGDAEIMIPRVSLSHGLLVSPSPVPREVWVILAGVAAGFYAITRPLDAICVLAPVALAWIWDFRQLKWRPALATIVIALVSAAPLLALQLMFDRAITGHALETPLDRYNRIYFNVPSLGLQTYDPTFRPPTPVRQIQKVYDTLDRPQIMAFTSAKAAAWQWLTLRLPLTLGSTTPTLFMMILLPAALAGLTDRRRWVLWSMSWCYLIGAGFFYIFAAQYTIAAAPAVIFAVVLAVSVIHRAWPASGVASVFVPLAVMLLAVEYIAINQQDFFEPIPAASSAGPSSLGWVSRFNYRNIPAGVEQPALVFFRFSPDEKPYEEPVYNWDVLNPDEAPIIRVHDLGPIRNLELLTYYQRTQPDRHVYLFDRKRLKTYDLGKVEEARLKMTEASGQPFIGPVKPLTPE
jgi:hypothetical protein